MGDRPTGRRTEETGPSWSVFEDESLDRRFSLAVSRAAERRRADADEHRAARARYVLAVAEPSAPERRSLLWHLRWSGWRVLDRLAGWLRPDDVVHAPPEVARELPAAPSGGEARDGLESPRGAGSR